jgi:ATP-binding cassette, subfamily C (CFTR/MRP), member 1
MLIGGQTMSIGSNVWLKQWAEKNGEEGHNPDVGKYIGIYFGFGIGSAALVVVQTLILWIFCSIEVSVTDRIGVLHNPNAHTETNSGYPVQASRKLHERMAFAIFRSPMSFFET